MKYLILSVALSIIACPATAQTGATVQTPELARLAAARELIDVVMPPADRDAMIENIIHPMLANIRRAVMEMPRMKAGVDNNPKLIAVLDGFMERQNARTLKQLQTGLPGMFDAMMRAYARRFTITEMADAKAFFATPSGRAYMQKGMTIMNDPDVQAWQRDLMQSSLSRVGADIDALVKELDAVEPQE